MRHGKIGGVILAVLFIFPAALPAQTTLRYKFKQGDKFSYVMDQKMKMTMNVQGKESGMNMNQAIEMAWEVVKVESTGNAQVKISFTGMKMVMDGPMGKVEVDSKSKDAPQDPLGQTLHQVVKTMGEMEMTLTMDATGDIKDVKIPAKVKESLKNLPGAEAMGDMFSDDGLKKMAQGGFILPKEAVSKGKTWTHKADMKMPMGRVKGDIQFTYDGQVDKGGKKLEKIDLKPNITLEADPKSPIQFKFKGQEGKGHALFDNDAGRLVEVNQVQTMEMTLEIANMAILQKIEQNISMRLK